MSSRPIISTLEELLADPSYDFGTIIDLDYSSATFVTQDYKIEEAGGIPQRSFLLAVPQAVEGESLSEAILLSVQDRVSLQQDRGFQSVKEELAISGQGAVDPRTQATLSTLGFLCDILGTFYKDENGKIKFGGDLDRIRGDSVFKVYKPRGRALSFIASFSNKTINPDAILDMGVVRFSETQMNPDPAARVYVNIEDFIGKKTAVFGLTRSGKSNTIKVLCQKTFEYAKKTGNRTGQLIFDPQGEYANTNVQDGESALADIGTDDEIRIYKILQNGEQETAKIKHLQFNILDDSNIDFLWKLVLKNLTSGVSGGTNYIASLENIRWYRPGKNADADKKELWNRQRLGLYGLIGSSLSLDDNTGEIKHKFSVNVGDRLAMQLAEVHEHLELDGDEAIKIDNIEDARDVMEYLTGENVGGIPYELKRAMDHGILKPWVEQIRAIREGRNGVVAAIRRTEHYHNDRASGDVRKSIWTDMEQGRLVIVDLSKGSSKTTASLSEVIVDNLVGEASTRFTRNQKMIPFQIVVEEAHNLFGRSGGDDHIDPWVRLSKEASKYHIGLVYATQEVTSVDPKILSNTSNWIIAHLNSSTETSELSRYYLFHEWAEHIRKSESKGFVRMKNESNPYIVPVQIDIFRVTMEDRKTIQAIQAPPAEVDVFSDPDDLDEMF